MIIFIFYKCFCKFNVNVMQTFKCKIYCGSITSWNYNNISLEIKVIILNKINKFLTDFF